MKRTIVYIDGFNLYYGLLRSTCAKWLDLYAFAKALLAIAPIDYIRHVGKKPVLVFNPHRAMSGHLKKVASYYKDIPRDLPEKCQLPESFTYGTHERVITRPAAWAPKE